MALYEVTGPDGKVYEVEGPAGATDAQVIAAVRAQISGSSRESDVEAQVLADMRRAELLKEDPSFFENILSGLGAGAVGTLESAALGAATLLDEENELAAREAIKGAAEYIGPDGGDPDSMSYKLASGVGSLGAFLGTALLGPAALPAAGALAVGAGAGEASERARAAGISEEDRSAAALKGALVGTTEILPLGRLASRLGIPVLTDMVNKLGPRTVNNLKDRVINALATGGVEGAQEATAATLQNLIEQGYNPDQTLVESVGEEGLIGGFAGALLGLFLPGKPRDAGPELDDAKDQAEKLLALPAPRMIVNSEGQAASESDYENLRETALSDTLPSEALRGVERNAEALQAERVRQEQEGLAALEAKARLQREATPENLLLGYEPTRTVTMPDGSTQEVPAEIVERTRLQEEQAKTAEEQRRAERSQGLEAIQRVAGEEARTGRLAEDYDLAGIERELNRRRTEADTARAQEELALAAAERGDEAAFGQPDLFPVELLRDTERFQGPTAPDAVDAMPAARDSAELRSRQFDLVTRAEDEAELARMIAEDEAMRMESEIESLTGRQVSAQQRVTEQRRRNILLSVIESTPSQNYNKVIRAFKEALSADGVQRTDPTPEETATIQRAVNAQRAFAEERQIPTTPESAQLSEMEALIPERGSKTAKPSTPEAPTEPPAPPTEPPAPPAPPTGPKAKARPVTAKDLKDLGIPKIRPVYKEVIGKDLNDPAQREQAITALDNYAKNSRVKASTKQNIQNFVTKAAQDVQPVETKPAASGKGAKPSVPSAPARGATTLQQPTERPAGTGRTGLGASKSDTAAAPVRKESKPAPLTKEQKAAEAKARQERIDKNVRELKEAKAKAEAKKATAAKEKETAKALSDLDDAIQVQKDLKAEKGIEATLPEVRAALRKLGKRVQTKGVIAPTIIKKKESKPKPKLVNLLQRPLDSSLVDRRLNEADIKKVRALPTVPIEALEKLRGRRALTNEESASVYFLRSERPLYAIRELVHDIVNKETPYTPIREDSNFVGPPSHIKAINLADAKLVDDHFYAKDYKTALKARKWIRENLSPEANDFVDAELKLAAKELQRANDTSRGRVRKSKEDIIDADTDALLRAIKIKEAKERDAAEAEAKAELMDKALPSDADISKLAAKLEAAVETLEVRSVKDMSREVQDYIETYLEDDIQTFLDAGGNIQLYLEAGSIRDLTTQVHPAVSKMLKAGNLQGALYALYKTIPSKRLRRVAKVLAQNIGVTKLVVEKGLKDDAGREVAGFFDPKTNTIKLNSDYAGSAHTLLHEVTHAVTSKTLDNKSHPVTKKLQRIYEEVKESLGDAYGARSLDEFVAEVFTNPEFRKQLASIRIKDEPVTVLQKVLAAISNFVRRMLGMDPVTPEDILTKVDGYIEAIIAPSVASRDAGKLYMASALGEGGTVVDKAMKAADTGKTNLDAMLDLLRSAVPQSAKDAVLSLIPMNQLRNLAEKYVPEVKRFDDLIQEEVGRLAEVKDKFQTPVRNVAKWVSKSGPKVAEAFNNLVHLSTLYDVDPEKPRSDYVGKTDKSGNKKEESWDIVQKYWEQVGEDGQKHYRTSRNIYRYIYSLLKDSVNARLEAADLDSGTRKRVMDEILSKMSKSNPEVYFALTRSGDYRISYNAIDPNTGNLETYVSFFGSNFARERFIQQLRTELYKENKKEIDEIARKDGTDIKNATDKYAAITKFNKVEQANFANAPSSSFVGQIMKVLEANKVNKEAKNNILELMLNAMPERSIARAMQTRKGTLGFDNDAVKALQTKTNSLANQLVRMEFSSKFNRVEADIKERLEKMKGVAEPEVTALLGNEILRRVPFAKRPDLPNWSRKLRFFGFSMTLGLNASSAMVNLFQLPMVVIPYVAPLYGSVGGYKAALRSSGKAMRLFTNSGSNRKVELVGEKFKNGKVVFETQTVEGGFAGRSIDNYFEIKSDGSLKVREDMNLTPAQKKEIAEFAELVEVALDMNQMNRSITYDILELDKISGGWEKASAISGFMFHHSERFGRQVSLATIYDLEIQKRKKQKGSLSREDKLEAAREAVRLTDLTNGGTAAAGTARIAQNGLGSVVFLFKRYAVSMYYLLLNTLNTALRGATPEDKRLARSQFAGIFGTTALLAGARGLPFFGALAMLYNLFADDDEDRFEELVAKNLGEPVNAGALNYITGLDIGSRISLADLLFRAPRIEKDQSVLWTAAEALGGPVVGVATGVEYGFKLLAQGEFYRATEQFVPAAFRSALRTARYADEGALTRRGDPVIEELNAFNLGAQFFGFAPAEYTQKMAINAATKRKDRTVNAEKTNLLRKYYVAMRQGDIKAMRQVQQKMSEFNRKNPLIAITPETMRRSMAQHLRTTQRMYNGVLFSPKLQNALMQDAAEYDSDISIWQ